VKDQAIRTSDVFKTQGTPTYTYVSASDGSYEKALSNAIQNKGTLCLITGPSKTGKTSLVTNVCMRLQLVPLVVRCNAELTSEGFWRKALEKVDFDRIVSRADDHETATEIKGEISGMFGWAALARLTGKVGAGLTKKRSEDEYREKILADPCPEHLIPILQRTPFFLIVEDFHYLTPKTQTNVFQQWKIFVDEQVSVSVLGTSHHAGDLAFANKDLIGRIRHLQMTTWTDRDLAEIARKGFDVLNVEANENIVQRIAAESVGLPLLTQAICLELLLKREIRSRQKQRLRLEASRHEMFKLFNDIAVTAFAQFEPMYDRIARGLRRRQAHSSTTYEYLLSVFTLDPIVYKLRRPELFERLEKLPAPTANKPSQASISQSLGRLNSLQSKMGVSLLEWHARDEVLYIVEPAFLFYLRWRKPRTAAPTAYDLFENFLLDVQVIRKKHIIEVKRLIKGSLPAYGRERRSPASGQRSSSPPNDKSSEAP